MIKKSKKTAKKSPLSVANGEVGTRPSVAGTGNRVYVQFGKTVNIGDFESVRVDIGMSEEIPVRESAEQMQNDRQDVTRTLSAQCLAALQETIEEVVEALK